MRLRIGRQEFAPTSENLKWGILALGRVHSRVALHIPNRGFIEARWISPIGIVLSHKSSPDSPIYHNCHPFLSYQLTLQIFQSVARDEPGWSDLVSWKKKGTFNCQFLYRKMFLGTRIIGFLCFVLLVSGFWVELFLLVFNHNPSFDRVPLAAGLLSVLGLTMLVNTYPDIRYWKERHRSEHTPVYLITAAGSLLLLISLLLFLIF